MYIKRTLEKTIIEASKDYSAILLIGPRQTGKSTMLEHLMEKTGRSKVSLDNVEERKLAISDPEMFLELHSAPVLIDEVQYAPELFSYIKMRCDNGAAPGSYWLTGSRAFQLMDLAQESLAGRVAIIHMSALSQSELYGSQSSMPFTISLQDIKKRSKILAPASPAEIYERIWNGAMPGYRSGKYKDREIFYSSYVETYINRDVSDIIQGVDKLLFSDFIRAAACRIGQILNVHDIAGDVGITDERARRWLKVLEKSEIIFYLRPYSNNLLKRTIKTPKMYFFDTGLVAFLAKYTTPDILMNGAINGAILENYVVSEIIKSYRNNAKSYNFYYYRDKDAKEIDLIMESDGKLHPLEIKKSTNPGTEITSTFKLLDKSSILRDKGAILCLRQELSAISSETLIIPVWMI